MRLHPLVVKTTMGCDDIVQPVAADEKPNPVTVTTVPGTPDVGESVMLGATVKEAVGSASAPGLPVNVTVYVFPATVAILSTTNVPVAVPLLIEHAGLSMRLAPLPGSEVDVKVHDESVNCKPLPTNEIV